MEQTKEKKYIVGSILCGLLTAFGIAATVISLLNGSNGLWSFYDCINLAVYVLIAYYAFIGYKKPHGNILKSIILVHAMLVLFAVQPLTQNGCSWRVVIDSIQIGLTCYTAGRLHKVKENIILMIAITVCIITAIILDVISGLATIGATTRLIFWLDICVAYFLRYKQHREAGLEDAPKK